MKRSSWKHRSTWIDITFSIALVALTIAAIYLVTLSTKEDSASATENKKSAAEPTPIIVKTINSNYPGIKIITETSNDPFSPFAIQYPQSLHSSFNKEVSAYITKAKREYIAAMKKTKEQGRKLTGELNISFETLLHPSGNYSFVVVTNTLTGRANGKTAILSFHLNPETGKSITLADVLGHDLLHLEKLSELVRNAIVDDPGLKEKLVPKNVQNHTKPLWKNFSNFTITDESLIFYFKENGIAAKSAGPPIIAIPIDKVSDLLADEFKVKVESVPEKTVTEKTVTEKQDVKEEITTPPAKTEPPVEKTDDSTDTVVPPETHVKKIALTFDDGPDPKVTMQILATLNKYNAKATFFMLGSRVEYYPEIAKKVQEAGHELGNHTWNHPDLTKVGLEKVRSEITSTSTIIEKVTGQKVSVFRPPYGAVNKSVRAQTDLPVTLWDVDTLDWKHRDSVKLLANIKSAKKDGSIVLMHDIHQSTADGLDSVLAYLQSEGYEFVTVTELK
ncbi:polysaccharide deacetylase family protein [Filibacter tadaridae]|uniref:Peptidoglycan-N-acetylmuramic acid deacetylase PdaC n=1 Tax=Filibacter tadaridae TaxID=2483811 RepID=A0A3P5X6Y7_9BACL|nr:polysaccharide deacetylase family protein [Filibacter tadaridae]VDC26631.1 Peptidoglycan-N-acetylmuramic acid deacetylase PdaC [Filibacter tadaridae]